MLSKRAQHLLPSLYDHNPMISMQFGFLMDNQTNVFWALNETCVINHFYDYAYLKRQWILEMISSRVLGWTGIRKDVSFGLTCSLWWIMDLFVMESPSSKNNRKNYRYRSIASFHSILIRARHFTERTLKEERRLSNWFEWILWNLRRSKYHLVFSISLYMKHLWKINEAMIHVLRIFKEIILLFSKDALRWSKVTVKTFIMLQNIYISKKCCYFELCIYQWNKNVYQFPQK